MMGLLIILCSVMHTGISLADNDMAHFHHYTVNEGLSSSSAYCMIEDRTGFLWVGTSNGLNRYDGYIYQKLSDISPHETPIDSLVINSLTLTPSGNIMAGTRTGCYEFDVDEWTCSEINYLPDNTQDIFSHWVTTAFYDSQSRLWIGTRNGVYSIDETGKAETYALRNDASKSWYRDITCIYEDSASHIWVGTGSGLQVCSSWNGSSNHFMPPDIEPETAWYVIDMMEMDNGNFILSTSRGLEIFYPATGTFRILYRQKQQFFPKNALLRGENNDIWFATNDGLLTYDIQTGKTVQYRHTDNEEFSLNSDYIRDLYRDRHGNIWIATEGGGLNKAVFPVFTVVKELFLHESLSREGSVVSFLEDKNGSLWIGTDNGLYKRDNNGYRQVAPNDLSVLTIFQDRDDTVWIGTSQNGLYTVVGDSFHAVPYSLYDTDGFSVRSIAQVSGGMLWIGTDTGLFALDPADNTVTHYKQDLTLPFGLRDNNINDVHVGPADNIYLATGTQGLCVYLRDINRFILFKRNHIYPFSINSNTLRRIIGDNSGNVIIATDRGVDKKNPQSDFFIHLNDLAGIAITHMAQDPAGNIWLTDGNNLFKSNSGLNTIKQFGDIDGFPSGTNITALYCMRDGSILCGCRDGYLSLRYSSNNRNVTLEPAIITRLRTEEETLILPSDTRRSEISILGKSGLLSLEFTSLDFDKLPDITYQYRLSSHNDDWHSLSWPNRTAVFTDLKPNTYRFDLRSTIPGTGYHTENSTIIHLKSRWYTSKWFKIMLYSAIPLYFISLFCVRNISRSNERKLLMKVFNHLPGLVYLTTDKGNIIYKNKYTDNVLQQYHLESLPVSTNISSLHVEEWSPQAGSTYIIYSYPLEISAKHREILHMAADISHQKAIENELEDSRSKYRKLSDQLMEKIEDDRLTLSREIHDELGQALTLLKIKTGWIRMLNPDDTQVIQDAAASISELIDRTVVNTRNICEELRPTMIDNLGLIPALSWYIENIEKQTEIACSFFSPIDFPEVNKTMALQLYRLIQEACTNVIRHAQASSLNVTIDVFDSHLAIMIEDDGIGIPEKYIDNISSFGILSMQERVKSLNGEFSIRNNNGNGTTIHCTIPTTA